MFEDFLSLFFPNYCQACNRSLVKGEEMVCLHCIADLPKTNLHLFPENVLKSRLLNVKKLQQVASYVKFVKSGSIQRLMHKIKYENKPEIGEMLGFWYGNDLKQGGLFHDVDLIIPVPLHISKMKIRGYNQSSFFAKGISRAIETPWNDKVITRTMKSETQTKKSKVQRWQNVSGIFEVQRPEKVKDKHVLLVDDVITTGSTLEACAIELEKYCKSISVATLAMA